MSAHWLLATVLRYAKTPPPPFEVVVGVTDAAIAHVWRVSTAGDIMCKLARYYASWADWARVADAAAAFVVADLVPLDARFAEALAMARAGAGGGELSYYTHVAGWKRPGNSNHQTSFGFMSRALVALADGDADVVINHAGNAYSYLRIDRFTERGAQYHAALADIVRALPPPTWERVLARGDHGS